MGTGTHTWKDSSETTSSTKSEEIRSWDLWDAYETNICNVIPRYSKIDKVKVSVDGKQNLSLSTGDIELYFTFKKDVFTSNADQIYYQKNGMTNSYKTFSADVTSYFTMRSKSSLAGLIGGLSNNYSAYYLVADCHAQVIRKFSLKNASLYYEFTYPTLTINVSAVGEGTVSGSGTWDVTKNTQTKTITATPKPGYKFVRWMDDKGNTYETPTVNINFSDSTVFVDSFATTLNCVALFDPIDYTITAMKIGGGYVSGAGVHSYGDTATLTAVPEEGYRFVEWIEDRSTENPRSFTVTGDATYTAYFEKIKNIVQVYSSPTEGGTFSGDGVYDYGTTVTLQAYPNPGYKFRNWSDNETANPRTITVTKHVDYIAYFDKLKYDLVITPIGKGTTDKEEITSGLEYNSQITVTAIPDPGYHFVDWGDGNTENPRTITITDTTFLYPTFEQDLLVLEITDGTVTSLINGYEENGRYRYGSEITIAPIEKPGYKFSHWESDGGQIIETGGIYYLIVLSDLKITAVFEPLVPKFKSVKIYYPSGVDVASPTNPLIAGKEAQIVVKIAME